MVPAYLTGAYGPCLAFPGASKRKEEEDTWSSPPIGRAQEVHFGPHGLVELKYHLGSS